MTDLHTTDRPITRRTLLASAGVASLAAAATGFLGGSQVLAGVPEHVYGASGLTKTMGPDDCVMVATIAELRADTAPDAAVHFVNDPGRAGHFQYDSTDSTTSDDDGTVIVSVSGKRYKRIRETEWINVKWFGARGDGSTDDSTAIQAANDAADTVQAALYFPSGTYRAAQLSPSVSWYSYEQAVIRSNASVVLSTFHGDFVKVNGKNGLVFEGLTFDGNVSADPVVWNSSTYNAFSGSVPLFLQNCDNIRLRNCTFRNSFFSTIRIVHSHNITAESCSMEHARGNFGDAVYVHSSHDIRFAMCRAEDYTRIGFVTEGGSYDCSYSQCCAHYGHHGSKHFGGAESNAGFWSENSQNVTFSQCVAENNAHRGFVCVTGPTTPDATPVATYILESCMAINADNSGSDLAFSSDASANKPIHVTYTDCYAFGFRAGFQGTARNNADSFTYTNCHIRINYELPGIWYLGFVVNVSGTGNETPSYTFTDCSTSRDGGDYVTELLSTSSMTSDILIYNSARASVAVTRFTNGASPEHVVLKSNTSGKPDIRFVGCILTVPVYRDFTSLSFESCTFTAAKTHAFGVVSGQGNVTLSSCRIGGTLVLRTAGSVRVSDAVVQLPDASYVSVINAAESKNVLVDFHNCRFEKNVAAGDYAVRVETSGSLKPKSMFHNCLFGQTTDTATTAKSFIWLVHAGTEALFAGCYADDTVTSPLKTDTVLSSPAGVTPIDLH